MTWSEHIEKYNGYHICSSTNKKCQSPIAIVRTWTSCTSGLQWSNHLGTGVGASPSDYSRESTVKCCCLSGNTKCDGCNYYEILREYQRQQQQIEYEQQQIQQQQIQQQKQQQQIQHERQKQIEYEQREQRIQRYMKDKKKEEKIAALLFNIFGLLVILIILYYLPNIKLYL